MNVKFNDRTRMLEVEFNFREVEEANLFRNIFPYNQVPKMVFNHRRVPINIPERLYITDTTFRDGQQSRSPYKSEQICQIYDLLHKLDNGSGIINKSEFFIYSKKDKEAIIKCSEKGYDFIRKAEQESARTCEQCGSPGEMRIHNGWRSLKCDQCYEQLIMEEPKEIYP